jgi:hypothetical protein
LQSSDDSGSKPSNNYKFSFEVKMDGKLVRADAT